MNLTFKKFGGEIIPNISKYVSNYLIKYPDVEIYIGCDSDQRGSKTHYATAIVLYHPSKGAHVVFTREKVKRIEDLFTRIWKEIEYARMTADMIHNGAGISKDNIVIDIDVNPDERFGSNIIYNAGVGYIKGIGYPVRGKPDAWAASCAADVIIGK